MKSRNRINQISKTCLLSCTLLFTTKASYEQPKYKFGVPTCPTSNCNIVGGEYRYSSVDPDGKVDALVSVDEISGNMHLITFDTQGYYPDGITPQITIDPFSTGYISFTITFVQAGTRTPLPQESIPVTAFDIDGFKSGSTALYEWDAFQANNGTAKYSTSPSEIKITQSGTTVTATNTTAIDKPGLDINVKEVMFTVVAENQSSVHFQTGIINNTSGSPSRLIGLIFQDFNYPNPGIIVLPIILSHFSASNTTSGIELKWQSEDNTSLLKFNVQYSNTNNQQFQTIGSTIPTKDQHTYSYTDYYHKDGFYRLELVSNTGTKMYSKTIQVKGGKTNYSNEITISSNPSASNRLITISAQNSGSCKVDVYSMEGKKLFTRTVLLQQGINNLEADLAGIRSKQILLAVVSYTNGDKASTKFFNY